MRLMDTYPFLYGFCPTRPRSHGSPASFDSGPSHCVSSCVLRRKLPHAHCWEAVAPDFRSSLNWTIPSCDSSQLGRIFDLECWPYRLTISAHNCQVVHIIAVMPSRLYSAVDESNASLYQRVKRCRARLSTNHRLLMQQVTCYWLFSNATQDCRHNSSIPWRYPLPRVPVGER